LLVCGVRCPWDMSCWDPPTLFTVTFPVIEATARSAHTGTTCMTHNIRVRRASIPAWVTAHLLHHTCDRPHTHFLRLVIEVASNQGPW
jgi:hypothetical protein